MSSPPHGQYFAMAAASTSVLHAVSTERVVGVTWAFVARSRKKRSRSSSGAAIVVQPGTPCVVVTTPSQIFLYSAPSGRCLRTWSFRPSASTYATAACVWEEASRCFFLARGKTLCSWHEGDATLARIHSVTLARPVHRVVAHSALPRCTVAVLDDCSIAVCAHDAPIGALANFKRGTYATRAVGCLVAPLGTSADGADARSDDGGDDGALALFVVGEKSKGKGTKKLPKHVLLVYRLTPGRGADAAGAALHTVARLDAPSGAGALLSATFQAAPPSERAACAPPTLSLLWAAKSGDGGAVLEIVRPTVELLAAPASAAAAPTAAAALRRTLPAESGADALAPDVVATVSGDGFVVVLRDVGDAEGGDAVAVNTWGSSYGVPVAATSISLGTCGDF